MFYVSLIRTIVYLYIHSFIESRGLATICGLCYLFYNIRTIDKILLHLEFLLTTA